MSIYWFLNINQLSIVEGNFHQELSLNDIVLLQYLDACESPKMRTEIALGEKNEPYYWVSYKRIKEALPLVYFKKSEESVYRDVKNLEKLGYVKMNSELSKKKGKTFMKTTHKSYLLLKNAEAKTMNLSEVVKRAEENLRNPDTKTDTLIKNTEGGLRKSAEHNTIISNTNSIIEEDFIFFPSNTDTDVRAHDTHASAREIEQNDFAADLSEDLLFEHTDIPKQEKDLPQATKQSKFQYPAFTEDAPNNIHSLYETAASKSEKDILEFEYEFRNVIDWRKTKSQKGETPIDHDTITIEFLKERISENTKFKKFYTGIKAVAMGGKIIKKDHYVYLYNWNVLNSPYNKTRMKSLIEGCTPFVESYYKILCDIHDEYQNSKKQDNEQIDYEN
jgi:hypothetical protein